MSNGREVDAELNRLAFGAYVSPAAMIGCEGAANKWAGTVGLGLTGALNVKAGITNPAQYLGAAGAVNRIAGITDPAAFLGFLAALEACGAGAVTPPAGGPVIADTFTRANGPLAAPWVIQGGTWNIVNNAIASAPAGGGGSDMAYQPIGDGDFSVEADFTKVGAGSPAGGMMFGSTLDAFRVVALVIPGVAFLYGVPAGGGSLDNFGSVPCSSSASFHFKLSLTGNVIQGFVDGVSTGTSTAPAWYTPSLNSRVAGLLQHTNMGDASHQYDNFEVRK